MSTEHDSTFSIPALPPQRQGCARSWLSRVLILCAWLATLALAIVGVLRVFFHDGTNLLLYLNAFTRYLYLPAYVFLAVALWRRRWWLAALNAVIVGYHLFWVGPDFLRDRRFDSVTAPIAADGQSTKHVRIFFQNIRDSNREFASLLAEIRDVNPDIIVIAEYSWYGHPEFLRSPLIATYPYSNARKRWVPERVAVYSRLPLQGEVEDHWADRIVTSVDVSVGSKLLHLIGLHVPRPRSLSDKDYEIFWQHTMELIGRAPHPLVVVGDFNATQYSLVYQKLKASGLRSAHEDRGRGYATTWPNGMQPCPPIRIDQAFLSSDVACLSIEEGVGPGSDHKPLIIDLKIRDAD